jgi:hypothetical protein
MKDKDIQRILRAKLAWRRELAKLPFDKKTKFLSMCKKLLKISAKTENIKFGK